MKRTPPGKLWRFLGHASGESRQSRVRLLADAVVSTFRFNISLLDYFYFRFYLKSSQERRLWAGTGCLYEFQLRMNPRGSREVLEDKLRFLESYTPFFRRMTLSRELLARDAAGGARLLGNPSGRVVLKYSRGQAGAEVRVVSAGDFTPASLLVYMKRNGYDLAEEYVVQHDDLMALSPSGLNTVRIITMLGNGKVGFLGARLRISVNSPVDNMAAGNLAAPVDMTTGEVTGPGVCSDITRPPAFRHPVTGKSIPGFILPFWKECVDLAVNAARQFPGNRSVGWDIAITGKGPELIEGNHNWCKLLWQLPVNQGLKPLLGGY